jgi:hypothetical protein
MALPFSLPSVQITVEVPVVFCELASRFLLDPPELARMLCEDFALDPPACLTIISRVAEDWVSLRPEQWF